MPFINFPDNPSIGDFIYVGSYKYVWSGVAWERELINVQDIINSSVSSTVSSVVGNAPESLDTLAEISAALGDDENFASTLTGLIDAKADDTATTTALNGKYDKSGGTITGTVTITGATEIQNDTMLKGSLSIVDVPTDSYFFAANDTNVVVSGVPFKVLGTAGQDIIETFPFDGNTAWYKGNEIATVNQVDLKADKTLNVIAEVNNHNLLSTDAGKVLTMNSTSARTYTIQTDANAPMPVGTEIAFIRLNTGSVTINPASGVTLNSIDNKRAIKGRYGSAVALKLSADNWVLIGSLE